MTFQSATYLAIALFAGLVASAGAVERPVLTPGDSWTYKIVNSGQVAGSVTTEITATTPDGYAIRFLGQGLFVDVKGLTKDLGNLREVDGKTSDTHWLDFPLTPGKTWKVHDDWKNLQGSIGYDELSYKVIGEEEVKVEAGTFKAIKVSANGNYSNTSSGRSGGVVLNLWYAPEAKAIVKRERMNNSRGGSTTDVVELVKYDLK
jgi:hypothetical protein